MALSSSLSPPPVTGGPHARSSALNSVSGLSTQLEDEDDELLEMLKPPAAPAAASLPTLSSQGTESFDTDEDPGVGDRRVRFGDANTVISPPVELRYYSNELSGQRHSGSPRGSSSSSGSSRSSGSPRGSSSSSGSSRSSGSSDRSRSGHSRSSSEDDSDSDDSGGWKGNVMQAGELQVRFLKPYFKKDLGYTITRHTAYHTMIRVHPSCQYVSTLSIHCTCSGSDGRPQGPSTSCVIASSRWSGQDTAYWALFLGASFSRGAQQQ